MFSFSFFSLDNDLEGELLGTRAPEGITEVLVEIEARNRSV